MIHFLATLAFVTVGFALLAIRILLVRGGTFRRGCASGLHEDLGGNCPTCGRTTDAPCAEHQQRHGAGLNKQAVSSGTKQDHPRK